MRWARRSKMQKVRTRKASKTLIIESASMSNKMRIERNKFKIHSIK